MKKFLQSSFLVLSSVALLAGAMGSLLGGMWDFVPPKEGVYSFGNYFQGARTGALFAAFGLIPYWIFHAVVGDIRHSWADVPYKPWRLLWVVCWAGFLSLFFARSLAV